MHRLILVFTLLALLSACSKNQVYVSSDKEVQALHMRAVEYYRQGRDTEAVKLWQEVVTRDPEHVEAWHNLAVVQEQQLNDRTAAEKTLREAIKNNPSDAGLYSSLGRLLTHQGRTTEALQEIEQADKMNPGQPDILMSKGSACFKGQDYQCALNSWQSVAAIAPETNGIYFNIGLAQERLGLAAEAGRSFEAAAKQNPLNSEAIAKRGDMFNDLGDSDQAITWYEQAIKIEPALAWPHYNLGVLKHEQGDSNAAMKHYLDYLKLVPQDGNAWTNLGLIYLEQGRLDEALDAEKKAAELGPDTPHFHFNLGLIWSRKKCFSKAAEEWLTALRLNPAFMQPQKQLARLKTDLGIDPTDAKALARLKKKEAAAKLCR